MEGQDLQHLKFGTSSAELSYKFWVRSSLTGKYSVLPPIMTTTAQQSTELYTVSAADTWEHKTPIDGDTSNGFDDDANRSMTLFFTLAAGTNTGTPHTGWGVQFV